MNSAPYWERGARRPATAIGLIWLLLAAAAVPAQTVQPLRAGGVEIFYGVIPAEIILGYSDDHNERKMHGGKPAWGEHYHLIVTLFDSVSKERIRNAEVKASVFSAHRPDNRLVGAQKRLEPMLFAGAASYGNYFNMPGPAPYRIELEIRRAGARDQIKIPIEFRHSLVTTNPRR
ncbi:MAG TPA: hypothetical protein VLC73_05725 [Burkholderiales bacterium]|nr:hypothetical protein [Burkholderiales bacterium]